MKRGRRWFPNGRFLLLPTLLAVVGAAAGAAAADPRFWEAVTLEQSMIAPLVGTPGDQIAVLRCGPSGCTPVPFQVDERDASSRWALDQGAAPNADDQPGILDATDAILVMAADAGARAPVSMLPSNAARLVEVELEDRLGFPPRWLYLAAFPGAPRPASTAYVSYDPASDRLTSPTVAMGFTAGMPQLLSVTPDGQNLLDRLKIRATAAFLFGLIRISRGEGDLIPQPVSWRAGPIRIIRRQQYTIRIGFGVRSPGFSSDTFFYRNHTELPVTIRLRVPPRYIFTSIGVRAALDFRDLSGGWQVVAPGLSTPFTVDCQRPTASDPIDGRPGDWFALRGQSLTLVERLERGASLHSVRQRLWFRAGTRTADPPESQPGQCPGIGFELEGWDGVGGGRHVLRSISYALPADVDLDSFLATVASPLQPQARGVKAAHAKGAANERE